MGLVIVIKIMEKLYNNHPQLMNGPKELPINQIHIRVILISKKMDILKNNLIVLKQKVT
jgi:hypothetical protein